MKTPFLKSLFTPAGIGKKTLPFLMVGVFFMSCTRDLLFVDDLLAPAATGDELLVFKYEAEVTSYREYGGTLDDLDISRTIPDVKRSKFLLSMSKSGALEIFTEHLSPSEDFFSMPSEGQLGEVKYEHLVNNTMRLYDVERNLIGEFDASQITSQYSRLYSELTSGDRKDITFYNLMDLVPKKLNNTNNNTSQRFANFSNDYDNHPAFEVYRHANFDEALQQEIVNEVITRKNSGQILFVSGYVMDGTPIYRAHLGYDGDQLIALAETRIDFSDPELTFKELTNTKFDNFTFTINQD
jgi:hypothetical protein